jgi:hypothetical protein
MQRAGLGHGPRHIAGGGQGGTLRRVESPELSDDPQVSKILILQRLQKGHRD